MTLVCRFLRLDILIVSLVSFGYTYNIKEEWR